MYLLHGNIVARLANTTYIEINSEGYDVAVESSAGLAVSELGAEYAIPAGSILLDPRIIRKGWRPEGGPEGTFDLMVPLDLIAPDEAPVDRLHVARMQETLLRTRNLAGGRGTGVLNQIIVCEVQGLGKLQIADGFHRFGAIYGLNEDETEDYHEPLIYCAVRPNYTEEQLLDLRISASRAHPNLKFARAALWINGYWQKFPFHDVIDAAQAFGFASSKAKNPGVGYSDLSREDAAFAKAWAEEKSDLWGISAATVKRYLELANVSNPELVTSLRVGGGGGEKLEGLTVDHLSLIAFAFSYERNWEIQKAVADEVIRLNLTKAGLKILLSKIRNCKSVDAVQTAMQEIDPAELRPSGRAGVRKVEQSAVSSDRAAAKENRELIRQNRLLASHNRNLVRSNIVQSLVAAKRGLENAIHRNRLVVPRLTPARQPYFVVDATMDRDIVDVMPVQDHSELEANLLARAAHVAGIIAEKFEVSVSESESTAANAVERVMDSAEHGALQFLDLSVPSMRTSLLYRAMADEVERRKAASSAGRDKPAIGSGSIVYVNVDQIIYGGEKVRDLDFPMVAAHGILGLSVPEIAAIGDLPVPQPDVKMRLQTTRSVLQSAAR